MTSLLGVAWENVLVGLLGGACVSLLLWLAKRFNQWSLQRRFPVAGEYISRFEDTVDGAVDVMTAPATLRQRGNKISGTTELDGREWILQGDLSASGYIHGVYFAKDPVDKGIGNFFLRVHNDRRMQGLWSGYDSVNGFITSGRYDFQPLDGTAAIRPVSGGDALAILRIADEQLGAGYVDEQTVRRIDEGEPGFGFVAECHGQVVGFALCERQTKEQASQTIKAPMPRHLRYAPEVGVIKTVAVTKRFQGRGIGSQLTEASIAEFRAKGIGAVYSVAWKSSERVNIAGVLERQGFEAFAEVEKYWQDDSIREEFDCPSCGLPPCQCAAVMYSHVI